MKRLAAFHPACGTELQAGEHVCPATGQSFPIDQLTITNAALANWHAQAWAQNKVNEDAQAADLNRALAALRSQGAPSKARYC